VVAVLLVVVLLVLVAEEDNCLIYPGLFVSLDFGFTILDLGFWIDSTFLDLGLTIFPF
jgi:hypothetical protein